VTRAWVASGEDGSIFSAFFTPSRRAAAWDWPSAVSIVESHGGRLWRLPTMDEEQHSLHPRPGHGVIALGCLRYFFVRDISDPKREKDRRYIPAPEFATNHPDSVFVVIGDFGDRACRNVLITRIGHLQVCGRFAHSWKPRIRPQLSPFGTPENSLSRCHPLQVAAVMFSFIAKLSPCSTEPAQDVGDGFDAVIGCQGNRPHNRSKCAHTSQQTPPRTSARSCTDG